MEQLIVLAVLALLAVIGTGLVLGLIGYVRASALRRDVAALRRELADVRGAFARAKSAEDERVAATPAERRPPESELDPAPANAGAQPRTVVAEARPAPHPFEGAPTDPRTAPALAPSTSSSPSSLEEALRAASGSSAGAPSSVTPASSPSETARWGSGASAPSSAVPSAASVVAPPAVPTAARVEPKPRMPIEKLLGVTGAAVLGGIVLAIAGFYLYQYSVQQGWVTKEVRLAMGIVAGLLAITGSHPLKKRGYDVTADALAGGGIVVLYAAFWAAHQLFGVWPVALSFGLMVATTAFCAWLALRRSSQVVAALGLLGGFATPIVLSTGSDNPIGLFGYTLLVNLGFLSVAHKRRWPWTALLALVGTFVLEALWIVARMRGETFWIALVVLGLFTLLFTGFVALQPNAERRRFVVAQAGALVVPFLFALWFAARHDDVIGYHVAPLAILAALVLAASGWIAMRGELAFAPLGSAVGTVAVVLTWVLSRELELERAWELVVCCAALALVLHGAVELARRKRGAVDEALANSAAILALGLSFAVFLAAWKFDAVGFAPWCAGGAALALVAARQAAVTERAWLGWAGAVAPALAIVAWTLEHPDSAGPWIADAPLVWALVLAAGLHVGWFLRRDAAGRHALAHGAAIALAGGMLAWQAAILDAYEGRLVAACGGLLASAALAFTARRARSWVWLAVSALLLAMGQSDLLQTHVHSLSPSSATLAALVLAAGAALHTGVVAFAWLDSRMLARVRAVSAWLWLPALEAAFEAWGGEHARGSAAIALGGLVLIGRARNERAEGADLAPVPSLPRWLTVPSANARTARATAWTWSRATALAFAAWSVATFADLEIAPVALVLAGAGLAWQAMRERYRPLAVVSALVLLLGAFVLLVTRVGVTKPVLDGVVVNGLAWLFLASGAAAVAATTWLRAVEDAPSKLLRALAGATALAAVVLVFAWIHLAILNAFGTSPSFQWHSERVPTRDLTLSLAWGLYAFALLILGVSRKSSGLRWTSLVLFLATIAKTFLFDLGHLTGLYRVGSLFGLAMTLLAVSLLYQRFVFRRSGGGDAPSGS